MKKYLYLFIVIVAFLFGATFTFKNIEVVTLRYYFGLELAWPLSWMILISIAVGIILGIVIGKLISWKRNIISRNKQRKTVNG